MKNISPEAQQFYILIPSLLVGRFLLLFLLLGFHLLFPPLFECHPSLPYLFLSIVLHLPLFVPLVEGNPEFRSADLGPMLLLDIEASQDLLDVHARNCLCVLFVLLYNPNQFLDSVGLVVLFNHEHTSLTLVKVPQEFFAMNGCFEVGLNSESCLVHSYVHFKGLYDLLKLGQTHLCQHIVLYVLLELGVVAPIILDVFGDFPAPGDSLSVVGHLLELLQDFGV